MAASFLSPLLKLPDGPWVLRNATNSALVASVIESALERKARNRGLLGRESLAEGHALILAPCNSIHTFFMRFAIDVAFVDREGQVLRTKTSIRPWRMAFTPRAFAVVELAAGELIRAKIKRGDRLLLARE